MRTAVCALLVAMSAASAHAQPRESRSSINVIAGAGKTFDDEGSLGRGWLVGGAVDRVLFGTTRAEFTLELLTHDRDTGYFQANGRTAIAGASLVHRFGRGQAQPYVFGGITAGHHSGTARFIDTRVSRSNNDIGLRFGVGMAIRAGTRFEISPELRMNGFFIDNDSDPAVLPSVGVRFGIRL
jgi:hypothetical protein